MNWFQTLTGFAEGDRRALLDKLWLEGEVLHSRVNGRQYRTGALELVSLAELRARLPTRPPAHELVQRSAQVGQGPRPSLGEVVGDVRVLHRDPAFEGALFQVASQFNLLEMVSPQVTPDEGIAGYEYDRTQGPACAMACGAATIYRQYFVPVQGQPGQTASRQLDGLADVGQRLAAALGMPVAALWQMRNGYALCSAEGLDAIAAYLASADAASIDALRGALRLGVQTRAQVTDVSGPEPRLVSQIFCSALPVAYGKHAPKRWAPFARLVLEAAYEATLWAGVLNRLATGSNKVLLTRLGGGVFGNDDAWIDAALERALGLAAGFDLDLRMVRYGKA